MRQSTCLSIFITILFFSSSLVTAQYSHISFPIASSEFSNGNPTDYTMGVGDVDGDGKKDIIINTWVKESVESMFAYTLAYTVEGSGKGKNNGFQTANVYHWKPTRWEGPYLVDVDGGKLLWHHDGSQQGWLGWGDNHRAWVGDVLPDVAGLEIYVSGVLWESQKQWQDSLNYGNLNYHNLKESDMIFDCKGNIHNLRLRQGGRSVYPILWDDDSEAEIFNYRSGELSDGYPPKKTIACLKGQTELGGECTITDFLGDWREEIIAVADHKVNIFKNANETNCSYPNLWKYHNYRLHQASIGNGLPKPYPPDADWPETKNVSSFKNHNPR